MNCKGYQSTASHLTLLYQNTICTQHHDTSHVLKQVYVFFPCMVRTEKDSRTLSSAVTPAPDLQTSASGFVWTVLDFR